MNLFKAPLSLLLMPAACESLLVLSKQYGRGLFAYKLWSGFLDNSVADKGTSQRNQSALFI